MVLFTANWHHWNHMTTCREWRWILPHLWTSTQRFIATMSPRIPMDRAPEYRSVITVNRDTFVHPMTPLTAFDSSQKMWISFFPTLRGYYYHPYYCLQTALPIQEHGRYAPTRIFTPLYTHNHTHVHFPGEWLTLVAKPPCGFPTFIGCQWQVTSTETTALIKTGTFPSCLSVTLRWFMIQCLHSKCPSVVSFLLSSFFCDLLVLYLAYLI